ncbi:hypothetical protein CEK60_21870 [Halomonas sp. N3-2A]|nr:hypothetical protein [Halomonas sp. N3-2A]ASK21758.1 hypothetical protein CEK60_21870 [Halomonas sp. N3-2A]
MVNATATVGADGSYTTTEDLSSLVDGEITVDASAEDRNGNPVSDSDSGELDASSSPLSLSLTGLPLRSSALASTVISPSTRLLRSSVVV